jgi:hypothetical protein
MYITTPWVERDIFPIIDYRPYLRWSCRNRSYWGMRERERERERGGGLTVLC